MNDEDGASRRILRKLLVDEAVTLGLIVVAVALAYQIFSPLLPAILWGLLLAVICSHPYERLASRLKGMRFLADIAFGLVLLMVLLLPAIFFAWELITNFPILSENFESLSRGPIPDAPQWVVTLPVVGESIERHGGRPRPISVRRYLGSCHTSAGSRPGRR